MQTLPTDYIEIYASLLQTVNGNYIEILLKRAGHSNLFCEQIYRDEFSFIKI